MAASLVSDDGRITAIHAPAARRTSRIHFIGVQVADADVFADLPDGVRTESVRVGLPAADGIAVRAACAAFLCDATFRDIGTPADCLRTSVELAQIEGDRLISEAARIDKSAVVERSRYGMM